MTVVPGAPQWATRLKVTQWRVAVSEWTKLRSLRSTLWSLFVAVVFTIGLPCVFAAVTAARWSHMSLRERLDRHPLEIATAGVNLSQLAIGVLGVLIVMLLLFLPHGLVSLRPSALWRKVRHV